MTVTYVGSLTMEDLFPKVAELCSLYATFKTSYLGLKVGLSAAVDVLVTVEGGLDFILNASFGLIPLKAMAVLEFQGALRAIAGLTLAISNPLAQAAAAITAMAGALASLQASLALGLPTVSVELGVQLSAIAAVAAAAAAKMAGIQAVIEVVGSLLGPLVSAKGILEGISADIDLILAPLDLLFADFVLNLGGTGGVHTYTAACAAGSLASELQAALTTLPPGVAVGDQVRASLLLVNYTSNPTLWGNVSFVIRTTP